MPLAQTSSYATAQRPLTFDFCDLKLRDFAKLWLFKLIIVGVVVVNFISGLLNNINNKENNSKPQKGRSNKTIFVETNDAEAAAI